MAKVNLEVKGGKRLLKRLEGLSKDVILKADQITNESALQIELDAQRNLDKEKAIDTGRLKNSITTQKIADAFYRVYTGVKYAPYIEFGTGDLVRVPDELQQLASLFKGAGIRKVNLMARPYMWPAFIKERPEYIKTMNKMLIKETKEFN